MAALSFIFERREFDVQAFNERILRALKNARDESARVFVREMLKFFTQHTWSGAAQATLIPLAKVVKGLFYATKPTWDYKNTGWRTWHEARGDADWLAQHGQSAGIDYGRGIAGESVVGEPQAFFEYGHSLLHFTQGATPNHWTILDEMRSSLPPVFVEIARHEFAEAFKTGTASPFYKKLQEIRA